MAEANSRHKARPQRPLSPHLQIYKPDINMVMSIVHRLTGAALYFGTLILAWWLIAAAAGPDSFNFATGILKSWPGQLVLVGYTWAFLHHMLGGLRHFIWDMGKGYDLAMIDQLSWSNLVLSVVLTAGIWGWVLTSRGGL